MSAMTDGSWISIGKSFNLTVNTTEKEFVDFYSDAMKQLKDKHEVKNGKIIGFDLTWKVCVQISKNVKATILKVLGSNPSATSCWREE